MPTEAQKRTRDRWDAENMAVISCKLKREIADAFKAAAKSNGTTPNELFRGWIAAYLAVRSEANQND